MLTGGMQAFDKNAPKAFFFQPTVLGNVKNHMLVMQQETEGPLITVQVVESDYVRRAVGDWLGGDPQHQRLGVRQRGVHLHPGQGADVVAQRGGSSGSDRVS